MENTIKNEISLFQLFAVRGVQREVGGRKLSYCLIGRLVMNEIRQNNTAIVR